VLIVSTDPAHSLGDALDVPLSSTPRRITPPLAPRPSPRASRLLHHGWLDAAELDAPRAYGRWLKQHRRPLGEILEHGTWLDRGDVDALLDLAIPGIDELMGMIEIDRLAARSSYDLIVVDTAPTGHTLRLLAAPETVAAAAEVLGELQQQHRLIREQLARVGRPEAADRLIAVLAEQAHETAARLRDPDRTRLVWVTLPEELALAETGDGIAALGRAGIAVREIAVNRVLPDGDACPVCDRRRADERKTIAAIRRRFGRGRAITLVAASVKEPRGLRALAALGRAALPETAGVTARLADQPLPRLRRSAAASAKAEAPEAPRRQPSAQAGNVLALFENASLLFFGGKGGVGKTTVAAAVAMRLARADPRRRVLLLSTDPAHSLGDVFRAPAGDTARVVPGAAPNLEVRELDAARALTERRAQFEGALDEIASAVGVEGAGAPISASGLINLAPPGIDELFGILSVVDARSAYDVIVVDTAPTGHALRLLEMPDAAREWIQVLLRVLLKYRTLVRPGKLAEELVEMSKAVRGLIALLRDANTTRFIVVTRAAELPRCETERLLKRLRRLHLSAPVIVVNARTLVPGRCGRCRAVAAAERGELASLRGACGTRCAIIQTPLSAPPPRGPKALDAWARSWL
jgi:arsenite-transporting ATPase